jgi:hypothetical protein
MVPMLTITEQKTNITDPTLVVEQVLPCTVTETFVLEPTFDNKWLDPTFPV